MINEGHNRKKGRDTERECVYVYMCVELMDTHRYGMSRTDIGCLALLQFKHL